MRGALALDPAFAPAAVKLADLYRATGRDGEGERVLRDALTRDPKSAALRHALGLRLVRQQRMPEALTELEMAARLAPDNVRYGYVYAVALHDAGRAKPAVEALARVLARHPYDRDTLEALVTYTREQGQARQALLYARRLAEIEPANPGVRRLVEDLEAASRR